MSINAHSVPPYISGSIKNRRPLIMADVFRPFPNSNNARRGMQNDIAQRLFRWVTPALRQVFSREPELAIWDDAIENAFPTRAVYEMENLDPSTVGWGKIYQRSATRGVVEFLSERFESSFVVGFELCPYQKDILNRLGTPYLSLAIHPLRFLNDYAFMIESNFVKHKHMRMFALDAADIKTAAHMRAASHASELDDKLVPNSAILFGQVDIDAALINGRGGFDGLFDFQNELAQLSSEHETVYFKPHPYQGSAEAQLTFLKQYNNVEFLDVNPYKLLSHPNISTVSALTSSILSEALIFDKKIKPLSPNWIDRSAEPAYGVSILSLKFWHYLVSQCHRSYRRLAECLKSHAGRRSNLYPGLQLSDVGLTP